MATQRRIYIVHIDFETNKTEILFENKHELTIIDGADFIKYIKNVNNCLCFVNSVKVVKELYPDGEIVSDRKECKISKRDFDICEYKYNKIVFRSISSLIGDFPIKNLTETFPECKTVVEACREYLFNLSDGDISKARYSLAHMSVKKFYSDIKDDLWKDVKENNRYYNNFQTYSDMLASNKAGLLSKIDSATYHENQLMKDISSAYPSVMVNDNKFPIGRITRVGGDSEVLKAQLFKALKEGKWCKIVFDGKVLDEMFYDEEADKTAFEFYDLQLLVYTKTIKKLFDKIDNNARVYLSKETGYLNKTFRDKIVHLYNKKSELKKGTFERFITKTQMDMLYGKSIQDHFFSNFYQVKNFYCGRGDHYLTPEMGNHCSAKIRYIMYKAYDNTDANYFDTDGVKCPNTPENVKYFDKVNKEIAEANTKAGFNGCKIGLWDDEGIAEKLLIFKPKIYFFESDGVVVGKTAGAPKDYTEAVIESVNNDISMLRYTGFIFPRFIIKVDSENKSVYKAVMQSDNENNITILRGDLQNAEKKENRRTT